MKIQCPAKINLFLEVTGKRPDGYHSLATLFAKINLYDVLDMEADGSGQIALAVETEPGAPPVSAGEDNLVLRAARAFYKAFRIGQGVKITLTKRIPVGAGLGGGSSDAAGTLLGLAKLFDLRLDARKKAVLRRLAAKLGADIPFFLHPSPFCLGTGIGDRLKPVKAGGTLPYLVLVHPGVAISTAQSYQALKPPSRQAVLTSLSHLDKLVKFLGKGRPVGEWEGLLFNRLEEAPLPAMAHVERARAILGRLGARGVRMSGSGSAVYGFVASHEDGERIVKRLQGYPWKIFLTSCHG